MNRLRALLCRVLGHQWYQPIPRASYFDRACRRCRAVVLDLPSPSVPSPQSRLDRLSAPAISRAKQRSTATPTPAEDPSAGAAEAIRIKGLAITVRSDVTSSVTVGNRRRSATEGGASS